MDGWMVVHSNDKTTDFVLIWGNDINTDTKVRVDSMGGILIGKYKKTRSQGGVRLPGNWVHKQP
jgi:hypothetical protein